MNLGELILKIKVDGKDQAKADISETADATKKSASESEGALSKLGNAVVSISKVVTVGMTSFAAGISYITKNAVSEYASYEQLVGGVETLFKDSSAKVMEYAKSAYKNQGLSANDYMETVTSFSASLLQSLNNDTAKSAEVADLAISDMADNANKMGTSMEMIQNAYQGFAKQNYTMLDNLKLGYGGTKEEMERLLEDASKLKQAQGENVEYSIDSFADIVEAIHVIQDEMDITGTTAKEAADTIEGSINTLKASWTNLLTGLADGEQNIQELGQQFTDAFGNVVKNVMPRVKQALQTIPTVIQQITPVLVSAVTDILPDLITAVGALLVGLAKALPSLIGGLIEAVKEVGVTIISNLFSGNIDGAVGSLTAILAPCIWAFSKFGNVIKPIASLLSGLASPIGIAVLAIGGLIAIFVSAYNSSDEFRAKVDEAFSKIKEIIGNVIEAVKGFIDSFCELCKTVWDEWGDDIMNVVTVSFEFVSSFIENILGVVKGIIDTVTALIKGDWEGVWNGIKEIVSNVWDLIKDKTNVVINLIKSIIQVGLDVIKGLFSTIWNAIKSLVSTVWDGIKNTVSNAINSVSSTVSNVLGTIKNTFSSIWDGIKNVVSNAIDGVKNTVSNGLGGAYNAVSNTLGNIGNKFSSIWDGVKNTVSNAISNVKNAMNFSWSLPHLSLPHISVTGGKAPFGIGGKGSLPRFSIAWYKKAMENPYMFDKPTIFGADEMGNLMGAGESGDEMMYGKKALMEDIRTAVNSENGNIASVITNAFDKLFDIMSEYYPQFGNTQLVLDTGLLVAETAPQMDKQLGIIKKRKERG